jgi:hypothetical protein
MRSASLLGILEWNPMHLEQQHLNKRRGCNNEKETKSMKHSRLATLSLCLLLSGAAFAQEDHTNRDAVVQAQQDTKQDKKVDKAQAKADKKEHKAMKSDKVKKAAKAQDKANTEAEKRAADQ